MMKRLVFLCIVGALCVGTISCERLQKEEDARVTLQLVPAQVLDSIPASYGRLVSVTSSDSFPGWAQLWFEREDRTIVVVCVDFQGGKMRPSILTIPRS